MEIYKTILLGKTVHFLTGCNGMPEGKTPVCSVIFGSSELFDFRISYLDKTLNFESDIKGNLELFLSRVRGYPYADYEIETPQGVKKASVNRRGFECFVNKCKVLYTNKSFAVSSTEFKASCVCCSDWEYMLIPCDRLDGFSGARASDFFSSEYDKKLAGVLGFSISDDVVSLRGTSRDGALDRHAYAATAVLIRALYGSPVITIVGESERVVAEASQNDCILRTADAFAGRIYP